MIKKKNHFILDKVIADYTAIAEEFDITRKHGWPEFRYLLPYLKENARIADIGCGNGRFYQFLSEKLVNFSYIGVDNNVKFLELAAKNFRKITGGGEKTKFIAGDLIDIPIKSKSQDLVCAIASLHHLPDEDFQAKSISEIGRILQDKGIFFCSVWNLDQPKYRKYVNQKHALIPWGKSGVQRFYYAFEPLELENLLICNGFEILEKYLKNNIVLICRKKF